MDRKASGNTSNGCKKTVEDLKAMIASGSFKPGQRLIEFQLCETLGVKRGRVREALRQLEQNGFIRIVPNVGAMVVEFSPRDIGHTYDLLSVIEGMAVRVSTPFINASQIEELEALLHRMEATDDPPLFLEYNIEFHNFFWILTENDRLIKLAENLRSNLQYFSLGSIYSPGQLAASNREHWKILEGVKEKKPLKAEKQMRDHLIRAKNRLIRWVNKSL
jgi:DNA-binding GntR family transcriptional regulator